MKEESKMKRGEREWMKKGRRKETI